MTLFLETNIYAENHNNKYKNNPNHYWRMFFFYYL